MMLIMKNWPSLRWPGMKGAVFRAAARAALRSEGRLLVTIEEIIMKIIIDVMCS